MSELPAPARMDTPRIAYDLARLGVELWRYRPLALVIAATWVLVFVILWGRYGPGVAAVACACMVAVWALIVARLTR